MKVVGGDPGIKKGYCKVGVGTISVRVCRLVAFFS